MCYTTIGRCPSKAFKYSCHVYLFVIYSILYTFLINAVMLLITLNNMLLLIDADTVFSKIVPWKGMRFVNCSQGPFYYAS